MRPAARAWEEDYANNLKEVGFIKGSSASTVFHHPDRDLEGVVHGDDFTFLGYEDDLAWIEEKLKSWYIFKTRVVLGPENTDLKEIIIFNRTVKLMPNGIEITADPKHAKIILDFFEIHDESKS